MAGLSKSSIAASLALLIILPAAAPPLCFGQAGTVAVGSLANSRHVPTNSEPKPIAVVKTWNDLLKQQPIPLKTGGTIRLGIEATEFPQYAGVLLYGLTEGWAPSQSWDEDNRLGPVCVTVSKGDGEQIYRWLGGGRLPHQVHPTGLSRCKLLFARRIMGANPGDLRVTVVPRTPFSRTSTESAIGQATLRVASGFYHPWTPWKEERFTVPAWEKIFPVTNGSRGMALPDWLDMSHQVFEGTVEGKKIARPASERLPTLVPEQPSMELKVSAAGDLLTLRSEAGFGLGPQAEVLTRWWVNDKPFIPEPLPQGKRLGTVSGVRMETKDPIPATPPKEIVFRLDLDLRALKANNGDRIGLQLLYCHNGWDEVSEKRTTVRMGWKSDIAPRLSNRVEWIAR